MEKKKISLIIGVVLSIMAIVFLNLYLRGERQKNVKELEKAFVEKYKDLVTVFIADEDIEKGSILNANVLSTKIIPNKYVEPQAVTSLAKAVGMKAAVPIKKEEQITLSKLINTKTTMARSLAMATPVGKRAITISVDSIMGLAGMIVPGDYVDVIALLPTPTQGADGTQTVQMVNIPIFQNVLVIAVGGQLAARQDQGQSSSGWGWGVQKRTSEKIAPSPLITLALSSQDASLLSFVNEQGRLRLVIRSPADAKIEQISPASWETLFSYINSLIPSQDIKDKHTPVKAKSVEIYRGENRDSVYISE